MHEHLLAARNALLGTTNLLMIALPHGWRLIDGPSQPEVDRWVEYRHRRWMSQGFGAYRLVEPHPERGGLVRCEVELTVAAAIPGARNFPGAPDLAAPGETGRCEADGHSCTFTHGMVVRGFWPRQRLPALALDWACEHTRRRLRLLLRAVPRGGAPSATAEDLTRVLSDLAESIACH